jgi:hypothetical protein
MAKISSSTNELLDLLRSRVIPKVGGVKVTMDDILQASLATEIIEKLNAQLTINLLGGRSDE